MGFDNYVDIFTETQYLIVLRNTFLWVLLTPILATGIGLLYAVLVDRARGEAVAKAFIFLPMAISLVGASIIWKFVYEYRPEGVNQIGAGQPDPGLARARSLPVPAPLPVEHAVPYRHHDLDSGGLRNDGALRSDQSDP